MPVGLDIRDEQLRTAIKDPAALKRYLRAAQKDFIVLQAEHLVDALWPDATMDPGPIQSLMQIISAYRDHRRTIPSGYEERVQMPARVVTPPGPHGVEPVVPVFLGETLSLPELQALARWVTARIQEEALLVKESGWAESSDGTAVR